MRPYDLDRVSRWLASNHGFTPSFHHLDSFPVSFGTDISSSVPFVWLGRSRVIAVEDQMRIYTALDGVFILAA